MSSAAGHRPTVALIGANGHGRWHRRHLADRADRVDLVAVCDPAPIEDASDAPVPGTARRFTDHRDMFATVCPDIAIICTPPHTHLEIATAALRSGCDILMEKPPVLSVSEHDALEAVLAETGRAAQIGFQALGSRALARLVAAIESGELGEVTGVAAVAAWQRSDAYYARAPWAGRRQVDGRPTLDGAVVNPLAHAVMQALVVAHAAGGRAGTEPSISSVELERYRARPIEVEDTASLRLTLETGPPVVIAVTLCGEEFIPGEIIVHGTGDAVLEYPTDRLALPGDGAAVAIAGRVSLLDNLLDHRADPTVALIAPLPRTRPFTELVDVITAAPPPALIDPEWIVEYGEDPDRHRRVAGVDSALRRCGERLELLSEQGLAWTTAPHQWPAASVKG